jgi:hypothetical protein
MQTHDIKILPEYFEPVLEGIKTFEIRKNDRNYQIGDQVNLHEYSTKTQAYTGRVAHRTISYITDFMQKPGFVVFGITK